jgi:molybdopterin synthase catalytic subunit
VSTVKVRLFARLAELAGTREADVEVGEGLTAGDAFRLLARSHPQMAPFEARVMYAVNREYVDASTPLRAGDELALIPPVSGGSRVL